MSSSLHKENRSEVEQKLWIDSYMVTIGKGYGFADAIENANKCLEEFRKQFPTTEVKSIKQLANESYERVEERLKGLTEICSCGSDISNIFVDYNGAFYKDYSTIKCWKCGFEVQHRNFTVAKILWNAYHEHVKHNKINKGE